MAIERGRTAQPRPRGLTATGKRKGPAPLRPEKYRASLPRASAIDAYILRHATKNVNRNIFGMRSRSQLAEVPPQILIAMRTTQIIV